MHRAVPRRHRRFAAADRWPDVSVLQPRAGGCDLRHRGDRHRPATRAHLRPRLGVPGRTAPHPVAHRPADRDERPDRGIVASLSRADDRVDHGGTRGGHPLLHHLARQPALGGGDGPSPRWDRLPRRHRDEVGGQGNRRRRQRPDRGQQPGRRPRRTTHTRGTARGARPVRGAGGRGRWGWRCRHLPGDARPRLCRRPVRHPLHRHHRVHRERTLQGSHRPGPGRRHRPQRTDLRRPGLGDPHPVGRSRRHPGRTAAPIGCCAGAGPVT